MASQELINQVKQDVIEKFADLKSALLMREKLLLRQLDVINTTSKQQLQQQEDPDKITPGTIEFFGDNEQELLAAIRSFGRLQLTNINLTLQNQNEDYIEPSDDHETMFKGLNQSIKEGPEEEQEESIVVDFSHHKTLMERNAKMVNESIINITLKEAKELIKQTKTKRDNPVPPLNLEELDDEVESSIAEVVSSLEANSEHYSNGHNNKYSQTQQNSKQKRFKPKITINNCNGTINLRNIASLTINCSTEENIQAQIPVSYAQDQRPADTGYGEEAEEPSSSTRGKDKQSGKSKTLVESLVSSSSNTEECTSPTSTTSQVTTPNSLSNYSSNNSSRSHSKKHKNRKSQTKNEKVSPPPIESNALSSSSTTTNHEYPTVDCSSSNEVTCDFYNRLLNEIKRSINQQQKTRTKCSSTDTHHQQPTAADSTSQTSTYSDYISDNHNGNGRRLILKNFENLKIILEANSSGDEESFHPVQIEQWLAEIISETDLEPMQNTDILEHSKIHNEPQET
ncbi:probable serine/threonine-protein kinase dyrk2 [Stomoxys calcitrans]|uniref:Uncharacterized protein n=1 Tax=Stomoxys calcitrans TaxID=35570 RepID=A0A1I8PAX8_STOCA|nr:probable serine/threonine-protein kinase dyrk2 [Stomoxys calcitrans]